MIKIFIQELKGVMGIKHDLLTNKELSEYSLKSIFLDVLEEFTRSQSDKSIADIRILDWGCGRGRAVLKLLEMGYSAYGMDIDRSVLNNGIPLFSEYGFNANEHLIHFDDINEFPDGYFDLIISDQVFEHIENLEETVSSHSRLTKINGMGCHVFPSSRMITEPHLNMPFVHWLPKNPLRKPWILAMRLLSKQPDVIWPETRNKSLMEEINVYYDYLDNKTFYRSNNMIKHLFESIGFEADYIIRGKNSPKRRWLPDFLLNNGFPDQQVHFIVRRK